MLYDLSKLPLATRQAIEKDYFEMFSTFPKRLLSIGADTKTVKGEELNVLTGITAPPNALSDEVPSENRHRYQGQ